MLSLGLLPFTQAHSVADKLQKIDTRQLNVEAIQQVRTSKNIPFILFYLFHEPFLCESICSLSLSLTVYLSLLPSLYIFVSPFIHLLPLHYFFSSFLSIFCPNFGVMDCNVCVDQAMFLFPLFSCKGQQQCYMCVLVDSF